MNTFSKRMLSIISFSLFLRTPVSLVASFVERNNLLFPFQITKPMGFLNIFSTIRSELNRIVPLHGVHIYTFGIICLLTIILSISLYYSSITLPEEKEGNHYQSKVWMSALERDLIRSYLNRSHTMLEYGSGYSTLYFAQFVASYYSIEHDRRWYTTLSKMIRRSSSLSSKIKQYKLVSVEPGYKGWPGGFEEGNREQFDAYIKAVHSFSISTFDRVLIDGRARSECALQVKTLLHHDSIVFIHDYTPRPFYWKIIEKHYEKILQTYQGQTLAIFRPRL